MSAKAAQEALGNLALFRRKCEANLAEAENKASVAESEANELKKKIGGKKDVRRVNSEERTEWRRFDRYSIRKSERGKRGIESTVRAGKCKTSRVERPPNECLRCCRNGTLEIEIVESDIAKLNNDIAFSAKTTTAGE